MKKNVLSESGVFNPRWFFALLLISAGGWLAMVSLATPTPATGTLSRNTPTVTYTDSTGAPPNLTHLALGKPNCGPNNVACSVFTLTIDPSINTPAAGYIPAEHQILVQWHWDVSTVDFDVFIVDANNNLIGKNTSTSDPSSIVIPINASLQSTYKLIAVLSTGAPIPYTATATLQLAPPPGACNPAVANCTPPRYQNFPAGPGQANNAGEPSIGVDWNPNVAALKHDKVNTGGVSFFTSGRNEWRVNFDDCSSPAINLWEDVSTVFNQETALVDPIGFVDHYTSAQLGIAYPPPHTSGRVFSMQLIGGEGNSLSGFSDDDGNSYLPGGNGGPGQGPDHETLGGGPYAGTPPAGASYPASGTKNAIYYCSQNTVVEAQCSRSDNGGQTFGPAVPIFTPSQCTGGIHGHVKVAPDGTVYVPNSSCGTIGTAGAAVSTDNGLTWTERNVADSTTSQDPSIGIGQNNVGKPTGQTTNTIYLGYVDGDGHAKIARSRDRGATYSQPVDVGGALGVTHAVFPVVVAGDDNRAAFAFVGTGDGISTNANPCNVYGATLNCKNIWHLYVATTYDAGANWITVDVTPDDPVQKGTICLEGTTCAGGRNLLDFNDFGIDSQGRGLVGWADGCVNCNNTFTSQSSAEHGTVTRQSGGRRLFAFFDPVEPAPPAAPQLLTAVRVSGPPAGVLLNWLKPDNGGSPITGYKIYRSTTTNTETFLASVTGEDTNKYVDTTADSSSNYFYRITAINAVNEGPFCREVSVESTVETATACAPPFIKVQGAAAATNDPTGQFSIQRVNFGEPFVNCSTKQLTTVLKVNTMDPGDTGTPAPPPVSTWEVYFKIPGSVNSTGEPQTVFLEYDNTTLPEGEFLVGWIDPATGGDCSALFLPGDPENPATGTVAADGTITMNLNLSSDVTLGTCSTADGTDMTISSSKWKPGLQITDIQGKTYQRAGGIISGAKLNKAQTTGDGTYTTVGNVPGCNAVTPVANLAADPKSGPPPLNVTFDGSASSVPSGSCGAIASYTMDFGDGTAPVTKAEPTFTHTYNTQGEFPAQLTVTNSFGQTSTNAAQVIISVQTNTPPTAALRANPTDGTAPLTVHFDGTQSADDDFNDTITTYTFHFGDGTPDVAGGPIVDHTYTTDGSFAARLVVTDSRGLESENTAQQIITVNKVGSSPTPSPTANPSPTATATASPSGTPTATASPTASASPTATASGTPTATATPSGTPTATPVNVQLLNISGRVFTQSGDKVGIGGFIVSGSSSKRIMARAIGPSMEVNGTPVQGRLTDPVIELHDNKGSPALFNDNWRTSQEAEIEQSGLAPSDDNEAAIIKRLDPGNYTAIIRNADGSPGIGLIELYDLSSDDPAELGNLSVRADVETGDNVLFNGLILRGGAAKRVLFRAIGPSIKVNGAAVPGTLADPVLEVHDANGGLLETNDDWKDAANKSEIEGTGLAPTDDHESAILLTLPSANYTSIVRGKDDTTGIALAEAYKLNN